MDDEIDDEGTSIKKRIPQSVSKKAASLAKLRR